jgi:lipooligosaccharide transport system ATP-binding protein
MLAVEARGLEKRFQTTVAVDGIELEIPVGGCFGFLGPNGAGKTTTIKMITCVSPPTAGQLYVLGRSVLDERRAIKARLGVVPQGMTLDGDLTARENLISFGAYHSLPRRESERRADELLEFAQLSERAGAEVEELSGACSDGCSSPARSSTIRSCSSSTSRRRASTRRHATLSGSGCAG